MKQITRFNPTANGSLHLGHLYAALVNQGEAHRSGGKFIIRFDDDQRYWNWKLSHSFSLKYAALMLKDLEYFGVNPDKVEYQTLLAGQAKQLFRDEFGYTAPPQAFSPNRGAAEVVGMDAPFYPFVESITADKVVFDFIEGVTLCIRGIDLLTEDCLYRYFVERFQLPMPRMVYIPRLQFEGDAVSKTEGSCKLTSYISNGYAPAEVVLNLAYDCLLEPRAGWFIDNVKPNPILGEWANVVHP